MLGRLKDAVNRMTALAGQQVGGFLSKQHEKFAIPAQKLSNARFQAVARKMLEQGQAEQELLVKHGLTGTLLNDLAAAVAELDASVSETLEGKQGHVLASRELRAVSEEVMLLVGMMDGVNRYRFQRDTQLLEAWDSAKHVVVGPQTMRAEAPSGSVTEAPGEVPAWRDRHKSPAIFCASATKVS